MAKPRPVEVPSDDCVVTIDGVEYRPHEGEWVMVVPGYTVAEHGIAQGLFELQVQLDALKGEPEEQRQRIALLHHSFGEMIDLLQDRIIGWNWTDMRGRPYPQPEQAPEVFRRLDVDEVYYLVAVVRSNNPATRKKDSRA